MDEAIIVSDCYLLEIEIVDARIRMIILNARVRLHRKLLSVMSLNISIIDDDLLEEIDLEAVTKANRYLPMQTEPQGGEIFVLHESFLSITPRVLSPHMLGDQTLDEFLWVGLLPFL